MNKSNLKIVDLLVNDNPTLLILTEGFRLSASIHKTELVLQHRTAVTISSKIKFSNIRYSTATSVEKVGYSHSMSLGQLSYCRPKYKFVNLRQKYSIIFFNLIFFNFETCFFFQK